MSEGGEPEALRLPPEEMRRIGYYVVDSIIDHVENLAGSPIGRKGSRSTLEKLLREPIPQEPTDPRAVLEQIRGTVLRYIIHVDHPRFFAFIPSPSNIISVLADTLASGFNVFAGTWLEGSGAAQIELVTIEWLRQIVGLPETAGGLFVSGGSVANLTALALARESKLGRRADRAVVYCSDQTHFSVDRALRVLGFEEEQTHRLMSDGAFRLPPAGLRQAIAEDRSQGLRPFCVVANAGTTNTGAVDPLNEIAELCGREGLWLHIDGAYGAATLLSRDEGLRLTGIERADSLAIDPHKWLFQPYETGVVLVRDRRMLRACFHIMPEYLMDVSPGEDEVSFCDYGIQLTRSFRALKVWATLKVFGLGNIRRAIERGLELSHHAETILRASAPFVLVTPAQMGIVTFRLEFPGFNASELDNLNQRLVFELMEDGLGLVSSTVLRGRTVLRMCTINPRTTRDDIETTVGKLEILALRLTEAQG